MNFVFFVDITKSPLGFRINAPARMAPIVYHFSAVISIQRAFIGTLEYVRPFQSRYVVVQNQSENRLGRRYHSAEQWTVLGEVGIVTLLVRGCRYAATASVEG